MSWKPHKNVLLSYPAGRTQRHRLAPVCPHSGVSASYSNGLLGPPELSRPLSADSAIGNGFAGTEDRAARTTSTVRGCTDPKGRGLWSLPHPASASRSEPPALHPRFYLGSGQAGRCPRSSTWSPCAPASGPHTASGPLPPAPAGSTAESSVHTVRPAAASLASCPSPSLHRHGSAPQPQVSPGLVSRHATGAIHPCPGKT